jgi:hypothetical protein
LRRRAFDLDVLGGPRDNGPPMPTPVLIDCDPGYDDVIAIMLALASPEVEVLAIARCTFIRPSPNSCRRCCPTSDR